MAAAPCSLPLRVQFPHNPELTAHSLSLSCQGPLGSASTGSMVPSARHWLARNVQALTGRLCMQHPKNMSAAGPQCCIKDSDQGAHHAMKAALSLKSAKPKSSELGSTH